MRSNQAGAVLPALRGNGPASCSARRRSASRGSCARESGTAVRPAAHRRTPAALGQPLRRQGAQSLQARRSSLPMKPPYRSSSTSVACSRARALEHLRPHAGQRGRHARAPPRHGAAPGPRRCPTFAPSPAPSVFRLPITIGDLLMWMVLIGSRVTPSGSSRRLLNMRARIVVDVQRRTVRAGSCARSQTMTSFLLRRVRRQRPDHAPCSRARPRTCPRRAGRAGPDCAIVVRTTASFLRSLRQKSHSLGCRALTSRASAIVARTSDSASCAASCARPLARGQVLELERRPAVVVRAATRCLRAAAPRRSAPRRAGPSGRIRSAIRAHRGRSGCARTGSASPRRRSGSSCSPRPPCPGAPAAASIASAKACSGTPCSRQVCGRMPVSRQASGSGRKSGAGRQYSITGASISFSRRRCARRQTAPAGRGAARGRRFRSRARRS